MGRNHLLELWACRNQYDGNVHYGVGNNATDEQSQLGTKYSVPQMALDFGVVQRFDSVTKKHLIMFGNGGREYIDMSKEGFGSFVTLDLILILINQYWHEISEGEPWRN
ncbi:hypothetical protein P3L10_001628 [Capsicum annuum]